MSNPVLQLVIKRCLLNEHLAKLFDLRSIFSALLDALSSSPCAIEQSILIFCVLSLLRDAALPARKAALGTVILQQATRLKRASTRWLSSTQSQRSEAAVRNEIGRWSYAPNLQWPLRRGASMKLRIELCERANCFVIA